MNGNFLRILQRSVLFGFFVLSSARAIVPEDAPSEYIQSLNGTWKFKLFLNSSSSKSLSYQDTDFYRDWSLINVPANWELQGFEEPQYGIPVDSTVGVYQRCFTLPASWRSRHIVFYSEGIAFGYELWINGKRIGSFASAFQRAEFDITPYVHFDQDNLLVIRVYRDHYQMKFDCTDDWALSGIFRDVYLYAAPLSHVEDLTIFTRVAEKNMPAGIGGSISVNHFLDKDVKLEKLAVEFTLAYQGAELYHEVIPVRWGNLKFLPDPLEFWIPVADARLWSAETPCLYDLQIILKKDQERLHMLQRRIGIRKVSIEEAILKINNRPIKLRGVCRLEIHPEFGRASREEQWLEDLEMMKKANINAVRMTHWPPHPRFLDLCDQLGFYVIDEVPFDDGDEKLTDALCLDALLGRAQNTIDRDKNHACVIIWSIGNEHPSTRYTAKAAQFAKLLDATRPVLYPDERSDRFLSGIPTFLDFFAPHYISAGEIKELGDDETLQKPVILTEYNHALDVAFDGLAEKWEVIESCPKLAGGMIWAWSDQGLYRKVNGRKVVDSYADVHALKFISTTLSGDVWLDNNTILDSHGQYGTDGIVYADRTPQTDYWETRKVYTPVKIVEKEIRVKPGQKGVKLTCVNRYDYLDLERVAIQWQYRINGRTVQHGRSSFQLAPHDTGKMSIPLTSTKKLNEGEHSLAINVIDHKGRQIYEHSVHLIAESGPIDYRTLSGPMPSLEQLNEICRALPAPFPPSIKLAHGVKLTVAADNLFHLKSTDGLELTMPFIRVGRKPTMAERRNCKDQLWEPPLLKDGQLMKKEHRVCDRGRLIYCEYLFSRPDAASQKIMLLLWLLVADQGWIDVRYDLEPLQCKGLVQELGLAMMIKDKIARVQWLGDGPYPAYPFKSELSERGIWSIEQTDRYFNGNRMNVDVALLTNEKRQGVGILGNAENLCWEQGASSMMLSHNLKVAGLGTKGTLPRALVPIESVGKISGNFRLWLLTSGKYPEFLAKLFP